MSEDLLRLGIIGCGQVVQRFHLLALRRSRRWRVVALAEPHEAWRERAAGLASNAQIFASTEDLLARSGAEAVLVASPPAGHRDLVLAALDRGLHTLVEKPAGLSSADTAAMLESAGRSNALLRVGYNRRFHPSYVQLRHALSRHAGPKGWSGRLTMVFSVHDWNSASRYLGDPARGGDVLYDVVSHQLDLLAWVFASPVAQVSAGAHRRFGSRSSEVRFEARLTNGARIECVASHGGGYREELLVAEAGVQFRATANGFAVRSSTTTPSSDDVGAFPFSWDRTLVRLGLRRDSMLRSFVGEWGAFADAVQGRSSEEAMASVGEAHRVQQLLEGLKSDPGSITLSAGPAVSPTSIRVQGDAENSPRSARSEPSSPRPGIGEEAAEAEPEVSIVIVVGDQRRRATEALRSVLSQDGLEAAEVLVEDLGQGDLPPLPGCEHPRVSLRRPDGIRSYARARARAVRSARGRIVAFIEEHCRVRPGWLQAIRKAFESPWTAVGPRVVSANRGVGFSDAMGLINYGAWTGPEPGREVQMLPGNNSAYLRQALLDLGPQLDRLLTADTVLQWRLMQEGGRLYLEPQAVLAHRYPTTVFSAAKGEFLYHIGFAAVRATAFRWSWGQRLLYAAASPVIPLLRLLRMVGSSQGTESEAIVRRNLPGTLYLLYAAAAGQAIGVLLGELIAERAFTDYELNEPRPTREDLAAEAGGRG